MGRRESKDSGRVSPNLPPNDIPALQKAMRNAGRVTPAIVTDGFCPGCGTAAPLTDYAQCAVLGGGFLVVDDTQSLGVFGALTAGFAPYGHGGGGSLQRLALRHPVIVLVSSLAKAFGVPVAMLAGSTRVVEHFRSESQTRVHCSPPSAAALAAALNAVELNRRFGDALRLSLAEGVAHFRRGLKRLSLLGSNSLFPVQPIALPPGANTVAVYHALLNLGVRPVLHEGCGDHRPCISFVLTVRHRLTDINKALDSLVEALPSGALPTEGVRSNESLQRKNRLYTPCELLREFETKLRLPERWL
ncbi:aminotransferase class I/II-fold pyridoxal phosphate-dependent enzyme [Tunturiibacter gelidiferens]|uniref:aminotransferase class I/II-fold pyridoxal phosphate-dependent enzyme n=1 Tax=Tunturiibacter gelidiferens TaxID=3069689 RepID=UPI003D9B6EDC